MNAVRMALEWLCVLVFSLYFPASASCLQYEWKWSLLPNKCIRSDAIKITAFQLIFMKINTAATLIFILSLIWYARIHWNFVWKVIAMEKLPLSLCQRYGIHHQHKKNIFNKNSVFSTNWWWCQFIGNSN